MKKAITVLAPSFVLTSILAIASGLSAFDKNSFHSFACKRKTLKNERNFYLQIFVKKAFSI